LAISLRSTDSFLQQLKDHMTSIQLTAVHGSRDIPRTRDCSLRL
jgi:hypothetical protein